MIDDVWASTGSDNFNRRSWTHDSELSAVVLDEEYARDLRLTLAAEHLDRLDEVARRGLREVMADCVEPAGLYDAYAAGAARLEAWHRGGRVGERPPGRLRPIPLPTLSTAARCSPGFRSTSCTIPTDDPVPSEEKRSTDAPDDPRARRARRTRVPRAAVRGAPRRPG